jgi:uncharacterized BrkB/YihY/UPF0761 family membrane protein
MRKLISNKTFVTGFFLGILLVILLNIFLPTERYAFDNLYSFGYPFAFYLGGYEEREGGNYLTTILWFGLLGNLIFTLLIGSLAGLSLRFLADKELNPVDFK